MQRVDTGGGGNKEKIDKMGRRMNGAAGGGGAGNNTGGGSHSGNAATTNAPTPQQQQQQMTALPSHFTTGSTEYKGTLFDTPPSLLMSPQYEMFAASSPFHSGGQFSAAPARGSTPTTRCANCNKEIQGRPQAFSCSHKVCSACCATNEGRQCVICLSPTAAAYFPPQMFLSPTIGGESNGDLSDTALPPFQSGFFNLPPANGGSLLGDINSIQHMMDMSVWSSGGSGKSAGRSSHTPNVFDTLTTEDHPPVFSPVSPMNGGRFALPPPAQTPLNIGAPPGLGIPNKMTCAACVVDVKATAFCLQCRELLCTDCVVAHQRVRVTRDHHVAPLSQCMSNMCPPSSPTKEGSTSVAGSEESSRPASTCGLHEARVVCACDTCHGAALCAQCLVQHATHKLIPLGDVRSSVLTLLTDSKHNEKNIDEALDTVRRMGERVDTNVQAVASEVRGVIHMLISALEERKREMLQRLDTTRQDKINTLKAQGERLSNRKNHITQIIKSTESITSSEDDDSSFASSFEQLIQLYSLPAVDLVPSETDVIKFIGPDAALMSKIRSLGSLDSGPCARTSHIVGESYKRTIRDRQTTISLQLKDACGDVSTAATQSIDQITTTLLAPDGQHLDVTMVEREPGLLSLSYFPTKDGNHQLDIQIRGISITGCPVVIDVRRGRNYADITTQGELFCFGKEGSGDGELCRPWGICIDLFGRVLVADRSNNRVQIFDKDGRFLDKFGTGGTKIGQFDRPAGVTTNTLNQIIVADKDNHRVQVFDQKGNFLLKFGERGRPVGMFNYPWGVATNSQNHIAVSDTRNHRVQIFNSNGQFMRKCGFDTAYFYKHLDSPRGLSYLPDGQLLITDFNNHRLAVLSPRNAPEMKVYGMEGESDGMFCRPQGVKVDAEGHILVCDSRNNRIQVFSGDDMRCVAVFGHTPSVSFQMPMELASPYQANVAPQLINFLANNAAPSTPRTLLDRPTDLAISADGRVYVVDFGNNCIRVF